MEAALMLIATTQDDVPRGFELILRDYERCKRQNRRHNVHSVALDGAMTPDNLKRPVSTLMLMCCYTIPSGTCST